MFVKYREKPLRKQKNWLFVIKMLAFENGRCYNVKNSILGICFEQNGISRFHKL